MGRVAGNLRDSRARSPQEGGALSEAPLRMTALHHRTHTSRLLAARQTECVTLWGKCEHVRVKKKPS